MRSVTRKSEGSHTRGTKRDRERALIDGNHKHVRDALNIERCVSSPDRHGTYRRRVSITSGAGPRLQTIPMCSRNCRDQRDLHHTSGGRW